MTWDSYHNESEAELRQERKSAEDQLWAASDTIKELQRQLAAQHRYIEELEKQLEPNVIAEIREELSEWRR